MPHTRIRHIEPLLKKSTTFWPVLCLLGARQVGKSTLLRSLKTFEYKSLDHEANKRLAEENPSLLLNPPLIVDEAQKVPQLFDSIKHDVDENKQPGKYILTGSVRFSKRTLIRESLTGRQKSIQLYPLTLAEVNSLHFENRWNIDVIKKNPRVSRSNFMRAMKTGTMPAIFHVRKESEFKDYWRSLIESYCYRDLLYALPKNPKPSIAQSILKSICEIMSLGEPPTFSRILKKTSGTRQSILNHLLALEDLMILNRLPSLEKSSTMDIFLPFDIGLFLTQLETTATHDPAIYSSCLQILLLNEFLATRQYSETQSQITWAQSGSSQKYVHFVIQTEKKRPICIQLFESNVPHNYDLRFLQALSKKYKGHALALTGTEKTLSLKETTLLPWEIFA